MNNSAYIRDIESLEQLRISIARFCEECENQLLTIDSKLQTRLANIKAVESHFLRMIESAEEQKRIAENNLRYCESSDETDEEGNRIPPNCDFEEEEVAHCRQMLAFAENNYFSFKREISNLEKSINEYQSPRIKYKTLIEFEKEAATSSLKQLINGAEDYLSVSAPQTSSFSGGLGITETIAKMDPTLMVAASVGVAEILLMSIFSFLGSSGNHYSISNKNENGLIKSSIEVDGSTNNCSELRIERKENDTIGKIVNVSIPPSLQNEKVGKHLINNMEMTCRANDCKEISGWASANNVGFYKSVGYQSRNEINDGGAEVYKTLNSNYNQLQNEAKLSFDKIENSDYIKGSNIGKQNINSLNIIAPVEINDEKFWRQHDSEGIDRYLDQIEKYDHCRELINQGTTLDEIKKTDFKTAIAYENFTSKGDTIRLQKSDNYYRIDGGGRHRVAAAQLYFLKTGKIVPIEADVREIN